MENLQNQSLPQPDLRIQISSLNDPGMGNAVKNDLIDSMRTTVRDGGKVVIIYANYSEELLTTSEEVEKFLEDRNII